MVKGKIAYCPNINFAAEFFEFKELAVHSN